MHRDVIKYSKGLINTLILLFREIENFKDVLLYSISGLIFIFFSWVFYKAIFIESNKELYINLQSNIEEFNDYIDI